MKKNVIAFALFAATSSAAFAQSAFEGAYAQLGIGVENSTPKLNSVTSVDAGVVTPYNTSISGATSFSAVIAAGYTFAVADKFLLGIGAEYAPLAGTSSSYSYTAGAGSVAGNSTKQSSYNVFISPGYAIDKDKLAYLKVGYTGLASKNTNNSMTPNTSTNYTGYALGLGYKQIIQGGLYGFGEFNYSIYNNQTNNTAAGSSVMTTVSSGNIYNFLVGLGYKF